MRLAPLFAATLFTLASAASRAADAPATLTLEQALASVENVNLDVLLAREQAAQAVEVAHLQRSGILPNIDASAQQRRSKSANLGNSGGSSSNGPTNRFDAQLTGSFALLDPERIAAWRAARAGTEVARAAYAAIVQDVLADVAQTYFAHLRNLRRLDVLDANIARAQSLLTLARNQLNAGVATQIDVTRAEAQLAVAEQARLQQVTALYESELVLKRLLDINPGAALRLEDFPVRRAQEGSFVSGDDTAAFAKRADYLAAQKAVEQAKLEVRAATFQRLPALTLTGQYGTASEEFDDSDRKEAWSAGVGISVPVFDGLQISADRRIALSRQRSQAARLHNLELQISSELRLARQDATSRNAQIAVAEKTLRLAQEELRLAQQRYQQGVADNREVVEALNRLAIADDNFVEAVFQYNLSRVELARARGEVRGVLAEKVP